VEAAKPAFVERKTTPREPALAPSVLLEYPSKSSFMNAMRRELLARRAGGKPTLLDFLLDANGEWGKGSFLTKKGRTIRSRYALPNPDGPLVHAGHMQSDVYAKAVGKREYLMLEGADLNWLTGQTGEAKGAYVSKPAVMIDGFPVVSPRPSCTSLTGCCRLARLTQPRSSSRLSSTGASPQPDEPCASGSLFSSKLTQGPAVRIVDRHHSLRLDI
jgi:hypothetical protein